MRVGILLSAAFPGAEHSLHTTCVALRHIVCDSTFGAVEVSLPASHARAVRPLLDGRDMMVDVDAGGALYRSGASLCSLDEAIRAEALRIAGDAIDAAAELGARAVSVVSGRDPGERDRDRACQALVDSIVVLQEKARAAGPVAVYLKMADRAVDKRFLVGPTPEGVEVARRVREAYPQFGLVLNLGHLPLLGEDPQSAARLAGPYLARVDIGNCVVHRGDVHPRFGVPESAIGVAELSSFLGALVHVGYLSEHVRPVVAFEVRPSEGDDPLEVIAESAKVLCQAWAAA